VVSTRSGWAIQRLKEKIFRERERGREGERERGREEGEKRVSITLVISHDEERLCSDEGEETGGTSLGWRAQV